ncbi:Sedlin [Dipodascopsis tothii]|uniref:Sedlin n=1 Tax=Dipodascopsis tothii TaxID=44089 RepID=UPI0034CD889A
MPSKIEIVALMGRENNPLFVEVYGPSSQSISSRDPKSLRYHFLAHISLDIFVAKLPQKTTDSDFGLLYVQDDIAMYGWMTNTGVKIVLGFASGDVVGNDIKSIFRAIQHAYISLVCNPFYNLDERKMITSKKFENSIKRIVEAWNGIPQA